MIVRSRKCRITATESRFGGDLQTPFAANRPMGDRLGASARRTGIRSGALQRRCENYLPARMAIRCQAHHDRTHTGGFAKFVAQGRRFETGGRLRKPLAEGATSTPARRPCRSAGMLRGLGTSLPRSKKERLSAVLG
jgi:hypothetical protein